jgi:hypothetical protein
MSAIDDWSRCTIIDDADVPEDARLCPECGSIISATSSPSIARMTAKGPRNAETPAGAQL